MTTTSPSEHAPAGRDHNQVGHETAGQQSFSTDIAVMFNFHVDPADVSAKATTIATSTP